MRTREQVLADIEVLNNELAEIRASEINAARAQILEIMKKTGMKPADLDRKLGPSNPGGRGTARKIKYRHPDGRTWTGAGRTPDWINSGNRESFRVV